MLFVRYVYTFSLVPSALTERWDGLICLRPHWPTFYTTRDHRSRIFLVNGRKNNFPANEAGLAHSTHFVRKLYFPTGYISVNILFINDLSGSKQPTMLRASVYM